MWTVGNNIAGTFMPDTAPTMHGTHEDAVSQLRDDMDEFAESSAEAAMNERGWPGMDEASCEAHVEAIFADDPPQPGYEFIATLEHHDGDDRDFWLQWHHPDRDEAREYASHWQSSGAIGSVLAQFATSGKCDYNELLRDIEATKNDLPPWADDIEELDALAEYTQAKLG